MNLNLYLLSIDIPAPKMGPTEATQSLLNFAYSGLVMALAVFWRRTAFRLPVLAVIGALLSSVDRPWVS
jgi:hypothetical protein